MPTPSQSLIPDPPQLPHSLCVPIRARIELLITLIHKIIQEWSFGSHFVAEEPRLTFLRLNLSGRQSPNTTETNVVDHLFKSKKTLQDCVGL